MSLRSIGLGERSHMGLYDHVFESHFMQFAPDGPKILS